MPNAGLVSHGRFNGQSTSLSAHLTNHSKHAIFHPPLFYTQESEAVSFQITTYSPRNVSSYLLFFLIPFFSSDVDTSSAGAGTGSYSLGESELLRTKFIKTLEVLSDNQREMQNEMRSNNDLKKHIVVLEAQARRHRP